MEETYDISIPFYYLKWGAIGLIITLILGSIIWIICSYYIFKWFKISANNYNFYLNEYNKMSSILLKKYGNYPIKRIYLIRHPISKLMKTCMNIVSFNKFNQELKRYLKNNKTKSDFFHIFHIKLLIEIKLSKNDSKFLILEKNNCVKITTKINIKENYELCNIFIKKNKYTLNEILEKTRKRIGDHKFFNWQIIKNNCQKIMKEILITLNKFNKKYKKFMYQKIPKGYVLSDFSLHTMQTLYNIINIFENILGTALWSP